MKTRDPHPKLGLTSTGGKILCHMGHFTRRLGIGFTGIYLHDGVTSTQSTSATSTIARRWSERAAKAAPDSTAVGDQTNGGIDVTVKGRWATTNLRWFGIAGAVLLAAGCSNGGNAVTLPKSTNSPTPIPSVSSAPESEAVKLAYKNFIAILNHADSLPESSRKQHLSDLMGEPQLSRVLRRIGQMKRDHITAYGSIVVHVKSIKIEGSDALLRDCQDTWNSGIMNIETKKRINRGVKQESIRTYLLKGDGGKWRVTKMVSLGEGCGS